MASDGTLARVTYLPGARPDSSSEASSSQISREAQPIVLPDFATFFGENPEGSVDTAVTGAREAVADEPAPDEPAPDEPAPGELDPDAPGPGELENPALDAKARGGREMSVEKVSMHALTRRGMSRWELERALLSRDFDEQVVIDELERLERVGLIDDAALAETLVRTQHERKGLGRGALTAELRRRHIDQEDIDAALEQVDDDDEQTRANELATKRAGQLSSYDLETAKRRLTGFLMRKGYSAGVVRAATDEALSSHSSSGRSSGVRFR